jgi:Tat protein translocase TatB subunit
MFNIGMQELLLVALVALIVLGPHKMPSAARQLGNALVQVKKMSRELMRKLQESLEEEKPDE